MEFNYLIDQEIQVSEYLHKNGYSSNLIIKLKKNGIMINGKIGRCDSILKCNDLLKVILPKEESSIPAVDKPIDIVYEDDYIIALYKPHGLAVMGTKAYYDNNLSSFVMGYFKKNNVDSTIHLINRLDKDTSGLVLIGKSSFVHHLFQQTKIEKKYYALVHGLLEDGIIDKPIGKEEGNTTKRKIKADGKRAITVYRVIKSDCDKSLVDIDLLTGRTHQIRVHFSSINHPLYGDSLYGYNDGTLRLESYYLAFIHPILKRRIEIMKTKEFEGGI